MSQLLTEKSVRRVISHREGALLRGLMFPGPFQFFHPGTHRQKQTFSRRLTEEKPSQKSPDDQEAELRRKCWSKLRGTHFGLSIGILQL